MASTSFADEPLISMRVVFATARLASTVPFLSTTTNVWTPF